MYKIDENITNIKEQHSKSIIKLNYELLKVKRDLNMLREYSDNQQDLIDSLVKSRDELLALCKNLDSEFLNGRLFGKRG